MVADDVLDDGQPESCSTGDARARRIDAIEPLKDALLVEFGYPDALVLDGDLHRVSAQVNRDSDLSAFRAVRDSVVEQVGDRGDELRLAAGQDKADVTTAHDLDALGVGDV